MMLDKKVMMMDAGTALFQTEKPYGTVAGGVKVELRKYGKVLRPQEIQPGDLPGTAGECDYFLDWSTPLRRRYISCKVDDAGTAGQTAEGEPVRRYAVSFKEGNRNTALRRVSTLLLAHVFFIGGLVRIPGVPRSLTILAGIAAGLCLMYLWLRPSRRAKRVVDTIRTYLEG